MAFSAMLRRAVSAATPLAARALRSGDCARLLPCLLCPISKTQGGEEASLRRPFVAPFSTSMAAVKPDSDADLLRIIDDEIQCALECDDHDRVEETPDRFPFAIQDDAGMAVITLTRNFNGEKIEVLVSMPSLVTGEEPEHNVDDGEGDEEGEKDVDMPSQSSIPLTVNVSKGDGLSLEFSCSAYPDELVIDSMSVRENKESDDEMLAYEGPDFNDLDENLQKAFHKYLEIRGISPVTTNFLHEYMINKDSREYVLWLRNLKQFVAK